MKKAANASPNRALKRERELRCWSQLDVAERIGTTAFNVSRWERGITFPGAYFRQQMCTIFAKSPQELDFLALEDVQAPTQDDRQRGDIFVEQVQKKPDALTTPTGPPERSPVATADPSAAPIWNIPYRRNPFFIGREEVLQRLHETFKRGDNTTLTQVQAQAISGLGGIGKTQTAIEYSYRYRQEYQTVLWARADTRELLIADFASIAVLLALPEKNDQDQFHAVHAVKRWLNTQSGWLLVLDNADDLDIVSDFMPEAASGHLLLTTRSQSCGQIAQRVLMEKLDQKEGALFLLHRAQLITNAEQLHVSPSDTYWSKASAIVELTGGLPLALDQAAAYIEETGCGLAGYLQRYQKRGITLLRRRGGLHPDHPEPVATTWSLSFSKVERTNPAAAELLQLCAFLHPDAISEDLLSAGTIELTPVLHSLLSDPFELDTAMCDLAMFSLVRRNADKHIITLHRLVQIVLREQMDEESQQQWAERAIHVVNQAFPVVSFTSWQDCEQYLPHALVCAEHIEQCHITTASALSLLNKAGGYLRERARYSEAEQLLTQALGLSEVPHTADELSPGESLNNLGMLYHDQGKYAQAEPLLQRALAIYEQRWGREHISIALCLSNLAENYRVQAKHDLMEELVRRALLIRERTLGAEHPEVAHNLNQLASLYHGQGKYSQAEHFYQRALHIRQQTLGPEHVDVAESLNNLAYLYDAMGKYSAAEHLYQQALAFCEKSLGAQHMYTAISLSNLAEVHRAQGNYAQSEQLHQRALAIREQTLGTDHPHIGKSLNFLAEIYLAQTDYSRAEALAIQALKMWEKALGHNHHYVAIGLDTLARLYCRQGNVVQAESLAQRALANYQDALGQQHHAVASSLNTLAEIYYEQKQYDQVEALLQRAIHIQEQILGKAHPATARSLHNLARLAMLQGDYEQAASLFEQALSVRQQALSAQHPDLVATVQQYSNLLRTAGNTARLLALEMDLQAANVAC